MLISGYHGTTLKNAKKILKSKEFIPSNNSKDWLGKGIYFYTNIEDAFKWRNSEVVLHTVIKIKENEYLDIDSEKGNEIFNEILDLFDNEYKGVMDTSDIQKNQCAIINAIWQANTELKVITCKFPKTSRRIVTLHDAREYRQEFCVRNNENIKIISIIKREDVE